MSAYDNELLVRRLRQLRDDSGNLASGKQTTTTFAIICNVCRKFGTLSDPDSVMKTVKFEVPLVSSQNSDGDLGHMVQPALTEA